MRVPVFGSVIQETKRVVRRSLVSLVGLASTFSGFVGAVPAAPALSFLASPLGAVASPSPRPLSPLRTLADVASPLRPGALVTWEMRLVGLYLKAPTEIIKIPANAPFTLRTSLWFGDHEATVEEISCLVPANALMTGTLAGDGIAPIQVVGSPVSGLSIPPLPKQATYTVSGIKILDGNHRTILEADPQTVQIQCLGDILITSVTSTPMTMDEIRDAGIQLKPGDYQGKRFVLALGIGSDTVKLTVPVAIPVYNGLLDPRPETVFGRLEIGSLGGQAMDITVVAADILPKDDPFTLSRPELSHALKNSFKALIVIPGSIGYLNQFFKVNLVIFNALSEDSPFIIKNLKATIKLPVGLDGAPGTLDAPGDDPLQLVGGGAGNPTYTKPVLGPNTEGTVGFGPDQLSGGQSGMATYFLEGLKEGAHAIDLDIQCDFDGGGLERPVPLIGSAQGKVLVRNPTFNLVLIHPDVVRKGEIYTLETRLTNTSGTLANGVSLTLDKARLGSVKLVDDADATQSVDTLKPGETVTFKFRLRALRNGEVRSSYLFVQDGLIGTFLLSTGLGERNIRLNPDTLVLPQTMDDLPLDLRDAMLRVLGDAYSIASTKAALPAGVLPIHMGTVTSNLAGSLSEQGLFLKMGVERARIWWELWRMFTQNQDAGFDQLMRTTEAGAQFREVMLKTWKTWSQPADSLPDRLYDVAQWSTRPDQVLVAMDGAADALGLSVVDAFGNVLQSGHSGAGLPQLPIPGMAYGEADGLRLAQLIDVLPGARLVISNNSIMPREFRLSVVAPVIQAAPSLNSWQNLSLPGGAIATVELGGKPFAQIQILTSDGRTLRVDANSVKNWEQEPFRVLAVHRFDLDLDPSATPFGTHLMVLFNRPNQPFKIGNGQAAFDAAQALIQIEANQFWRKVLPGQAEPPAALLQAYPRILSVFLEKPVGPYISRTLTMASSWSDASGHALQGDFIWPIQSGQLPGGAVVQGQVRKAKGQGLSASLSYWYQTSIDEGGKDLGTGQAVTPSTEPYFSLVTNNVATGPDGSYQLDFVPAPVKTAIGPFLLQGDTADGTAWGEASILGNGQVIQMDLVLEGKGSVEGYALDAAGQPVEEVVIQATQEQPTTGPTYGTGGGNIQLQTLSDGKGYYRLDGLKTGVFSMRALKGLFGVSVSNAIPSDGSVVQQNLLLKGKVGRVRAQLLDLEGKVVYGRAIRLGIPSGLVRQGGIADTFTYPMESLPDSDGWARFSDIPSGDIRLIVPSVLLGQSTVFQGYLDPDTEVVQTLRLLPTQGLAKAHFLVQDSKGNPVPGAYLYGLGYGPGAFAITDDQGTVGSTVLPPSGSVVISAYHPNWIEWVSSQPIQPEAGVDKLVVVTMPPRTVLRGTVSRTDGTPVRGAYVAIPPVYTVVQRNRLGVTSADGSFQLPSLRVGDVVKVVAIGPDLRTSTHVWLTVTDSPDSLQLVLPLVGRNALTGTVFQPANGQSNGNAAVAQVWVEGFLPSINAETNGNGYWGEPLSTTTGTMTTSADGKYAFEGLPQGVYSVHATNLNFPSPVSAAGDFGTSATDRQVRDLTLRNAPVADLQGSVYQKDGSTPMAAGGRVRLIADSMGGPPNFGELSVDVQLGGKYAFAKVIPPGIYKLRAEDPTSGDFCVVPIVFEPGVGLIKELRLWGRGKLTVHALDSLGVALPMATVFLQHSRDVGLLEANDIPVKQDQIIDANKGTITFENIPEGLVSVLVQNPTGLKGRATVEIPSGGGDAEVIVNLQPLGQIHGTFTRMDGTHVPAGRIDAYAGDGKWLGVSTTGLDGTFLLGSLPEGSIRLEAWDPDSRQLGKAQVTVVGNQIAEVIIQAMDKGEVDFHATLAQNSLERASVHIEYVSGAANSFSTELTTDSHGMGTAFLPPGTYTVKATDPESLSTVTVGFTRTNGQAIISVELPVQPVRSALISLTAPKGAPQGFNLEGWKIRDSSVGRSTQTDAQGQGLLRDLMVGSHTLQVTDTAGLLRGDFAIIISLSQDAIQPIPIQPFSMGRVLVTLTEADSTPHVSGSLTVDERWISEKTNALGQALIKDVLQGSHKVNALSQDGFRSVDGTVLVVEEGVSVDLLLSFQPTASLVGVLRDAKGAVVPYNPVAILRSGYSGWTMVRTIATDQLGAFAAGGLALGQYRLRAVAQDGLRNGELEITLSAPNQTVNADLVLKGLGTVVVHVTNALGNTVPGLTVTLANKSQTTDSAGNATFTDVLEGDVTASTRANGFDYSAAGTVVDGATLNLDLRLRDVTRLQGRIARASSAKLWPEGTRVLLYQNHRSWSYDLLSDGSLVDTQGDIDWGNGTGQIQISLAGSSQPLSLGAIPLTRNAPTVLDLRAPAFGSLQGAVTLSGQPVAQARVWLDSTAYQTDGQGLTAVVLVLVGTHRFQVTATGGMAWADATVQSDGQAQVIPLPLQNNAVSLPADLSLDRLGLTANLSGASWIPALRFSLDAAALAPLPTPPQGYWVIPGSSLAWEADQGDIHLTRITTSTGYGLRDQFVFQNRGLAAHALNLSARVGTLQGDDPQLGTPGQLGGGWYDRCTVAWGLGTWVPTGMAYTSYSGFDTLLWPAFTLQPGQTYSIWLGYVPHGQNVTIPSQDGYIYVPRGAPSVARALQRMVGQGPEWLKDLDGQISNHDPAPTVTDVLPAWDGSASLRLLDPTGQPVQALGIPGTTLTVTPRELLAPVSSFDWSTSTRSFSPAFLRVPPDGLGYAISFPTPLQGDLAWGQSLDLVLGSDWAVAQCATGPSQTGNHAVTLADGNRGWSAFETLSAGAGLRWTTQASALAWSAREQDNSNLQANGTTPLSPGAVTPIQIQFPVYGSLQVAGPRPLGTSASGYRLVATTGGATASSLVWANGGFFFPALPVGAAQIQGIWNLGSVQIQEGITTTLNVDAGALQVTALDAAGGRLAGNFQVVLGRDGNTQSYSNNSINPATISELPVGSFTVALRDPASGALVATSAVISAGGTTPVTLQLGLNGSLSATLRTTAGAPLSGVTLTATPANGNSQYLSTDSNGIAHFVNLGTGTASLSCGRLPKADAYDDPGPMPVQVALVPGSDVPVTLTVPNLGSVAVSGTTQAGDALPSGYYSIPNAFKPGRRAGEFYPGYNTFPGVVLGQPLVVRFGDGYYYAPVDAPAATPTADGQTLNLVFPLGRLRVRLRHQDQSAVPNVSVTLSVPGASPRSASTDATGVALFPYVPLGTLVSCSATSGGSVAAVANLAFTGPDQLVDLGFPAANPFTVHLVRANPNAPLDAHGWTWTITPGADTPTNPVDVLDAVFPDLYAGSAQSVSATLYLLDSLNGVGMGSNSGYWSYGTWYPGHNATWTANLSRTMGSTPMEATLTLPVRASVQLAFLDAQGHPMTGSMASDTFTVMVKQSTNPGLLNASRSFSSFDGLSLTEVFTEGTHVLGLHSSLWGDQPDITFTVGPQDDGKQIQVPVTLDWLKTNYSLRAVAGDALTPVSAILGIKVGPGNYLGLGYPATSWDGVLADTDTVQGAKYIPRNRSFQVAASYSGSWVAADGTSHIINTGWIDGASHGAGEAVSEAISLPLTVVRTRLTDTDGSSLEPFAVEQIVGQPLPRVRIQGAAHAALLGAEPGPVTLTLFDPASGLGATATATVPPLGQIGTALAALPAYAWMPWAALQDSNDNIVQDPTWVAVGADAPGLVRPAFAQWKFDPLQISWQTLSSLYSSQPDCAMGFMLSAIGFQGPPSPCQGDPLFQIRVPLQGTARRSIANRNTLLGLDADLAQRLER